MCVCGVMLGFLFICLSIFMKTSGHIIVFSDYFLFLECLRFHRIGKRKGCLDACEEIIPAKLVSYEV